MSQKIAKKTTSVEVDAIELLQSNVGYVDASRWRAHDMDHGLSDHTRRRLRVGRGFTTGGTVFEFFFNDRRAKSVT